MPNKSPIMTRTGRPRIGGVEDIPYRRRTAFLKQINKMRPGLTVVETPATCLWWAREIVETQFMCGDDIAGVFPPPVEFVKSVHSGGPYVLDEVRALATMGDASKSTVPREHSTVGSRSNYNFASDEGLDTLIPLIEGAENGCVTFAQPRGSLSPEQLVTAMHKIRSVAEKSLACAVMFFSHADQQQVPDMRDFCDEYFDVEECEPAPDSLLAFSIASTRLSNLSAFACGKVICNIRITDSGYKRTFEPFIAKSLLDRLIWMLSASGKSLAEIGSLVGLHKTSVKRHLDGMRPVRAQEVSQIELETYLDALSVDDADISESEELTDDVG
ncbi:hypothetical protein [Pandoraea communis]|uniref:Uncharacterized protein n=1 Tax=Pandoraea communis TaxID=2508297 RepID=A0A5E4Z2Z1_9BURK|nr:hypothetical protein [Pandoraea communis]MDM8359220.1 hypothetical protein [Pandoraea communis]VVE55082.1 hypothetical protein PCO31111_05012 [Pandoraea communis]